MTYAPISSMSGTAYSNEVADVHSRLKKGIVDRLVKLPFGVADANEASINAQSLLNRMSSIIDNAGGDLDTLRVYDKLLLAQPDFEHANTLSRVVLIVQRSDREAADVVTERHIKRLLDYQNAMGEHPELFASMDGFTPVHPYATILRQAVIYASDEASDFINSNLRLVAQFMVERQVAEYPHVLDFVDSVRSGAKSLSIGSL